MKHSVYFSALCLLFAAAPFVDSVLAEDPAKQTSEAAGQTAAKAASYYLIGNSLTWDTVPSKLDGDTQWHVDCGKSLPYIQKNPQMPCVKSSTLWPAALKAKQYDYVSVQPHYGSTLQQDVAVISAWMEMQPGAVFVIHTGWAHHAKRATEYAAASPQGPMQHSPAYISALLAALQKKHPGRKLRQTHAIDLLAKVAADAAAGNAAVENVEQLHRDAIHVTTAGRYLMHNAMRKALGQPRSSKGFEKVTPELQQYLDRVLDTIKSPAKAG